MSFITKAIERGRELKLDNIDTPNPINPTSNNQTPSNTPNDTPTKCGVVCQKKKKRKILLIGLGVLVIGGVAFFVLKKK